MKTVALCLLFLALLACDNSGSVAIQPAEGISNQYSIDPRDFAVIVNRDDPHSREVATYYAERRKIPAENIIEVQFDPSQTILSAAQFAQIKALVDRQTPKHVQFFVLSWTNTYRVECASITAAFAFGYSTALSACDRGCEKTKLNPYANTAIFRPYTHLNIRPTMMLAARDLSKAKELIDRGVAADLSHPEAYHRAFLLETSDDLRSTRKMFYPEITARLGHRINIHLVKADSIAHEQNVMFYFTGLKQVADIRTNHYLPGAIADHLTSFGGQMVSGDQMSALEWLDAGVTASYGTVVEPCAYPEKFPHPGVLMQHYLAGATAIEAYWKSVLMPGQGLFIGEPMARPYRIR